MAVRLEGRPAAEIAHALRQSQGRRLARVERILTGTALLALSASLLGGCGGQAATSKPLSKSEPLSWSVVEEATDSPLGSYEKTTAIERSGERHVLIREWVVYDFRRHLVDRRIGSGDDPTTEQVEKAATRAAPTLRAIYTRGRVLIWNPGTSKQCGTPWVEMPERLITQITGLRLRDLSTVEPQAMVREARGRPKIVQNDQRFTVYEFPVNGTSGLAGSFLAKNPGLAEQLEKRTVRARAEIPRDGGPIELTVDPTSAAEAATGRSLGGRLITTWSLERTRPSIDIALPHTVANASCLS